MLSRTADNLFWMARYIERTENTARLLDVNLTTSLLPQTAEEAERGWRALLGISELQGMFDDQYATLAPLQRWRRAACSTSWCAMAVILRRSTPACRRRGPMRGRCAAR